MAQQVFPARGSAGTSQTYPTILTGAAAAVTTGSPTNAFSNSLLSYDSTFRLDFASSPASAVTSNGNIGGP